MVKHFQNKKNADEDNNEHSSNRNAVVIKVAFESVQKKWISKYMGLGQLPVIWKNVSLPYSSTNKNSR